MAIGSGLILSIDLMLFHAAIDVIGAALGLVLANLQVLFVAFAAYLVYRDRPSRAAFIALPAVLVGAALLSGLGRADSYGDDPLLGVLLGIGAAISYAAFLMMFRSANKTPASPAGPLLDATLGAAAGALVLGLFDSGFDLIPSWPSHGWLVLMAFTVQVAGWLLIGATLPLLPALAGSFLILLQPVLGLVWGTTLLDEAISLVQGVGVALILAGIALVTLRGSVRAEAPRRSHDPGQMVGDTTEEP
jgi:drug/metabolite transporter (DMT)-like permease